MQVMLIDTRAEEIIFWLGYTLHMQYIVLSIGLRTDEVSRAFHKKIGLTEQWEHQLELDFPVPISCDGMKKIFIEHKANSQFGGLMHFNVTSGDERYSLCGQCEISLNEPSGNLLDYDNHDILVVNLDGIRVNFPTPLSV